MQEEQHISLGRHTIWSSGSLITDKSESHYTIWQMEYVRDDGVSWASMIGAMCGRSCVLDLEFFVSTCSGFTARQLCSLHHIICLVVDSFRKKRSTIKRRDFVGFTQKSALDRKIGGWKVTHGAFA